MSEQHHLGDWIRRRRADLDLTQELLAEQVGCAVATIRALEHGRRRASRQMVDRLAMMLRIPPEERDAFLGLARTPMSASAAEPARTREEVEQSAPTTQAPALLATKLFRPRPVDDVVVRARLVERLDQGMAGPLTLISAPAGFGKTTLVAAWLDRLPLPSGWLALDAHDDAPGVFLRYFVAALQGIDRAVGAQLAGLLEVSDTLSPPAVVSTLLNDLAALTHDLVLVLDDLHVITHPAIHEALAYLLDHMAPRLHLVMLTREDPPLPLARLRARRQLVELRAADLRFTIAEARAFLETALQLSLSTDATAALVGRTEGWIVGLQLAALSLRDLPAEEMATAIDAFTGNNRFVVDYLVDEVIAAQPPHLQQFLLQTSLLDRLCGPLCDAILLGDEPAAPSASGGPAAAYSQRLLEELERANLFLIPLDSRRHWYRYHHLFADVLHMRLLSGASPQRVAQLRTRASAWSEAQGLVPEAVQYALQAQDWDRVVRLIVERGGTYALHGHIETVLGWLDAVPEELVCTRPVLCLLHAGLLLSTRQFQRSAALLDSAQEIVSRDEASPEWRAIASQLAAMRLTLARFAGDLPGSIALSHRALRSTQPQRRDLAAVVGVAHEFLVDGDVSPAADRRLAAHLAALMDADHPAILLRGHVLLAWMRMMQGRLREAEHAYHAAAQAIPGHETGLAVIVGGPAYYFGLGDLLREWNDLDAAERLLDQGMLLARGALAVEPDILLGGAVALARLRQARGDNDAALATLHDFEKLAREGAFAAHLTARTTAMQARLALMQGHLDQAVQWANLVDLPASGDLSYLREPEYLTLARVRIMQARRGASANMLDEALRLLDRLLDAAEAGARSDSIIEILILRALAMEAHDNPGGAFAALARALTLAAPEGYMRIFVDEGAPMAALLSSLNAHSSIPTLRPYVERLLAAFPDDQFTQAR